MPTGTGKILKAPLMRVEHDRRYAVVASRDSAPKHPLGHFNVRAHPHVELQDGPNKQDMVAREVTGGDKTEWWRRAVDSFPRLCQLPAED